MKMPNRAASGSPATSCATLRAFVSNWRANASLDDVLVEDGVVGNQRHRHPFDHPAHPLGRLHARGDLLRGGCGASTRRSRCASSAKAPEMAGRNLSAEVSVDVATVTTAMGERIGNLAVLDLGVKQATIDNLAAPRLRGACAAAERDDRRYPRGRSRRGVLLERSRRPPRPPAITSSCCARCSMRGCRSSGSASATSCSGAPWASTPTSCRSGTAASTSRCWTSRPAGSRSRRTTTASRSRLRSRAPSTARTATARSRSATSASTTTWSRDSAPSTSPPSRWQYHPRGRSGPARRQLLFDRFRDLVIASQKDSK